MDTPKQKKYKVTMTKSFYLIADSEEAAQDEAVEMCADDSEALMPHNMDVSVSSAAKLPDSYFD